MKISNIIPRPVKNLILRIVRIPERIKVKIYRAAAHGKIPFPDKAFQKWDYKIHTGRKLNLRHPVTYQEKLQWLKYYYRNPEFTKLVDKYEVRNYVREKIGEEYLVPLYGVYNKWDEIDFSALPDEFVIKCTHDSGSVVICRDKNTFDYESAKKKIEAGLARNQFYLSREWPYKNVKPRIIIEEFLHDNYNQYVNDYKLYCFNGVIKMFLVCTDRNTNKVQYNYFDNNWNELDISNEAKSNNHIPKPSNYNQMVSCAELLSKDMPFVRIDYYESNKKMYFGEITFFSGGGRWLWKNHEIDKYLGDLIELPKKMR